MGQVKIGECFLSSVRASVLTGKPQHIMVVAIPCEAWKGTCND